MGRKHTALGRFRHENTAFRHVPGKKFVLYMGDDRNNEGVYKFVSERSSRSTSVEQPQDPRVRARSTSRAGSRRAGVGSRQPATSRRSRATEGTGRWVKVRASELDDTATKLRARFGTADCDTHFATNRPEDVEVAEDGTSSSR